MGRVRGKMAKAKGVGKSLAATRAMTAEKRTGTQRYQGPCCGLGNLDGDEHRGVQTRAGER